MSVEETFNKISNHQLQGMMFHHDMTDYFQFLSLYGFAAQQRFHYYEESKSHDKLTDYYIKTYHRLLPPMPIEKRETIPSSWMKYKQDDVSSSDRQNGIRNGFQKWIEWEKDTKALYNDSYLSLLDDKEADAAIFISHYLEDVSSELSAAEGELNHLAAMNFDMPTIVDGQHKLIKKYG